MYKIIGADGKEYGPISAEQLRQWIAEGRANALTRILPEGTTEWRPISDFPEFAGLSASSPPPFAQIPTTNPAAAEQVNGPAIGLLIVAILGCIAQVSSLAFRLIGASFIAAAQAQNPAWMNMFSGTVGSLMSVVAILISVLILVGALKMKKLENYGLAMTASVVAMIPCISPCCLIGLPVGIWALIVLSKPEVKSAFH